MEIKRDSIKFLFDEKIILNTGNILLNIFISNSYINNNNILILLKKFKNLYKYNFILENTYLDNSYIICFGFDEKITNYIGENNKIFILDLHNEYITLNILEKNLIYYFSDIKLYKEEFDFSYFIKGEKDIEIFLKLIFIKLIYNFYHKRNFDLKSVSNGYNERLDLIVGITCPNNCIFCNEGGIINIKKRHSIEENKKLLLKRKFDWVMLGDREPTISPDFIGNIIMCKKHGINTISVITGGFYFNDFNFCEKALSAGLNEIRFSLHGSNSYIHDKITQKKGSFDKIINGVKNLSILSQKYNFDIVILVVICKQNLYDLINILDLVKSYGISRLSFSFVEIVESSYINRYNVVPKITDVANEINNLIKKYELYYNFKTDSLNFENIPYCLIDSNKYIGKRSINYGEGYNIEKGKKIFKNNQYRKKEFLNKCYDCSMISNCEGINIGYKELFGEDEFFPIVNKNNIVAITGIKEVIDKNKIIDLSIIYNINKFKKIIIIFINNGYISFALLPYHLNDKVVLKIKDKYNLKFYKKNY